MKNSHSATNCLLLILILFSTHEVTAQTPIKKVLLEEYTTASCGNCPPKSALVNEWHLAHQANTILVTIHQGSGVDAMSSAVTNTIFNGMHAAKGWFAPAITMNRGVYPGIDSIPYLSVYNSFDLSSSPGIDSVATRLINEPAQVAVSLSGVMNKTARTIDANVYVNFADAVGAGDWRISLFLIEDSVIGYPGLGPFKGWDQHCYDATWANTNYPGKYDGTSIIGYPHRHVMRDALLGAWGIKGVIPSVPVVGTKYMTSAHLNIDTAYHLDQLKLVAFVSKYGPSKSEKYILNAEEVDVTSSFSTGIHSDNMDLYFTDGIDAIYPIPASDQMTIVYHLNNSGPVQLGITDILGQSIRSIYSSEKCEGSQSITFDSSALAKGIYFVTINTKLGNQVRKIVVE